MIKSIVRHLGVAALIATPVALQAQNNPIELGVDAGVGVQLGDPRSTEIAIPFQNVRANFFLGRSWSLETRLGYRRTSIDDVGSSSALRAEIGPMLNFGMASRYGGRPVGDWYVRPSLLIASNAVDPDDGRRVSNSDFGIAGAIGTRLPIGGDRLALRFEAQIGKFNDANDPFLNFGVGLSFFTR